MSEFHAQAPQATASEGLAKGPPVAGRAGFEPMTLRTKGDGSADEPPRPTLSLYIHYLRITSHLYRISRSPISGCDLQFSTCITFISLLFLSASCSRFWFAYPIDLVIMNEWPCWCWERFCVVFLKRRYINVQYECHLITFILMVIP